MPPIRSILLLVSSLLGCARAGSVEVAGGEADPPPTPPGEVATACPSAWTIEWAERAQLRLGACGRLQLDDDARHETVTPACDAEGHRAVYLIDDDAGRWAVEHDGWGHVPVCAPEAVADGAARISLLDTGPGEHDERWVALRGGRPVVVAHELSSGRDGELGHHDRWDFERALVHRRFTGRAEGCVEAADLDAEGSIVVVGGPTIAAAWIVAGAGSHHGPADASLRASASSSASGSLRIAVEVTDDQRIVGGASGTPGEADAVVLRWAPAAAAGADPRGCAGSTITELTITAAADGSLRWSGGGSARARVDGTLDRLTIDLDLTLESLGLESPSEWLPLTIEQLDVDDEGVTRLATSRFVDGQPGTLGALVRHPADGPWSPIGVRVD